MPSVGDASTVVEIAGFTTILGLITWLVRRVFTHTIPRLAKDYKDSLERQQNLFSASIDRQQDLFSASLDRQQVVFHTALAEQRTDFRESLTAERTDFKEALREEREYIGKRLDRLSEAVERLAQSRIEGGGNGL